MDSKFLDSEIYKKAKKKADETYKRNSAYKSMFLVKTYKDMGGRFKGKKELKGVSKWNKEQWVQVKPFLESNKKIPCGQGENAKACRPLKKIDSKTSITIPELLKIHSKKKLLELTELKIKNMDKRINWKLGKIYN